MCERLKNTTERRTATSNPAEYASHRIASPRSQWSDPAHHLKRNGQVGRLLISLEKENLKAILTPIQRQLKRRGRRSITNNNNHWFPRHSRSWDRNNDVRAGNVMMYVDAPMREFGVTRGCGEPGGRCTLTQSAAERVRTSLWVNQAVRCVHLRVHRTTDPPSASKPRHDAQRNTIQQQDDKIANERITERIQQVGSVNSARYSLHAASG